MARAANTTETIDSPDGVYLRRGGVVGPAELVILSEGRVIVVTVNDDRLLKLAADATHMLWTKRPS